MAESRQEQREQERANKQGQPGPAQADPKEDGPMDDARFQAWASEIGLTDAQWLPVRVVLDREFERGLAAADRARPQSRFEDATGGKPFGECSREELLEACRWFWMARDEARAELAADRAREPDRRLAEALTLLRRIRDDGLPSVHNDREWRAMVESVVSAFLASGDGQ